MAGLHSVRLRFPAARLYLWQTAFPPDAAERLSEPLAFVEAEPAAIITIGTVTLRLTLRLLCVAEHFFDPARPLDKLLARLEMEVDSGPTRWLGGSPGPDGHLLCGAGHRWSCACQGADRHAALPLFCSLRESYLRPAWRHPHVMARCERPLLQRCEAVDKELLSMALQAPLRLCLSVYRADDDEGPDEPEA